VVVVVVVVVVAVAATAAAVVVVEEEQCVFSKLYIRHFIHVFGGSRLFKVQTRLVVLHAPITTDSVITQLNKKLHAFQGTTGQIIMSTNNFLEVLYLDTCFHFTNTFRHYFKVLFNTELQIPHVVQVLRVFSA
jgi:hypothetical protein